MGQTSIPPVTYPLLSLVDDSRTDKPRADSLKSHHLLRITCIISVMQGSRLLGITPTIIFLDEIMVLTWDIGPLCPVLFVEMNPSWYHNTSWKSIVFTFKEHLWNSLTYLGSASVKRDKYSVLCVWTKHFYESWIFQQKLSHQDARNGQL